MDSEHDDDLTEDGGTMEGGNPTRRVKTRRSVAKKAKKTATAAPAEKVDVAAALIYAKSKLRSAASVLEQAFWKQEVDALAERVKKADEARKAGRSFTSADGRKITIGSTIHRIVGVADSFYGTGRKLDEIKCEELVVEDIGEPMYPNGPKKVQAKLVNGKGSRTFDAGGYGARDMYADRDKCFAEAIKTAQKAVDDTKAELSGFETQLYSLIDLRDGNGAVRATPTSTERTGKRWTEDENAQLRDLVAAGKSPEEIAGVIGRPRDRVVRQMHKLAIKPSTMPLHDLGRKTEPEANGDDTCAYPTPDGPCRIARRSHMMISSHTFVETERDDERAPSLFGGDKDDAARDADEEDRAREAFLAGTL